MSQRDDPRPPLPEWIMDAYAIICAQVEAAETDVNPGPHSGLTRERTVELLLAAEDLAVEQPDVEYALDRLLERGYIYEVDEELRVTFPRE